MSGTVLTAALAGALVALTGTALTAYAALATRHSVTAAADAAALAAADVAAGAVAGYPCETAGSVAAANGSALVSCELDGLVVTVVASRVLLGIPVTAAATAGPAP